MPGGHWVLDTGHFPRPATGFTAEIYPTPSREGFAEGTRPYGLLLDYVEWEFFDRWAYLSAKPVQALADGTPSDPGAWNNLVDRSPALRERLAVSAAVFEQRSWRDDLALWEGDLCPALVDGHRRIQRVDPSRLDADELVDHLATCRQNLQRAIHVHHRLDVTPVLPVGDLLVQMRTWTGSPADQVIAVLRGAGPLAVGASAELARLAGAARDDPAAVSVLQPSPADPAGELERLRSMATPVGAAVDAYVDLVGHWSSGTGLDVGEPSLVEMPDVLLATLRTAVAADPSAGLSEAADDSAADLRRSVPPAHRPEFDDLLSEARLVHRLRDERALSCDVLANGLMRRAILAAGTRLADGGKVEHPGHLLEATWPEMRSLVEGRAGPPADELARRARERETADGRERPVVFGDAPQQPVPVEWLEPGPARTERALRAYLSAMAGDDEPDAAEGPVRGQAASPGVYEGTVRVVRGTDGFERIRRGDVLVTVATSPAFNAVLPLVGAVVTDLGGVLSHAAIVAREYGIPAVVGCGDATTRLDDGAAVRIDGSSGEITPLPPNFVRSTSE